MGTKRKPKQASIVMVDGKEYTIDQLSQIHNTAVDEYNKAERRKVLAEARMAEALTIYNETGSRLRLLRMIKK